MLSKMEQLMEQYVIHLFKKMFSLSLSLLDGEFESVTRIVCSEDWQERMQLFARAGNNGTRRAPVTQDQASCWVLRRREKRCASSAPLTLQNS